MKPSKLIQPLETQRTKHATEERANYSKCKCSLFLILQSCSGNMFVGFVLKEHLQ